MRTIALALVGFMAACGQSKSAKPKSQNKEAEVECRLGDVGGSSGGREMVMMACKDGKWVVDEAATKEANESMRRGESQQADLLAALPVRKLTGQELKLLRPGMNTIAMVPYNQCDKDSELYDLLLRQLELQSGIELPVKTSLSKSLGEYNRCPQEYDNRRALEALISKLQDFAKQ